MGFVYFIQAVNGGLIKIGTASDVDARFRHIQAMCPVRLRLLGQVPGSHGLEARLHREFADARVHGEWFRPVRRLVELVAGIPDAVTPIVDPDSAIELGQVVRPRAAPRYRAPERLLPIAEVAKRLRVDPHVVLDRIASGRLGAHDLSRGKQRSLRVSESSLADYQDSIRPKLFAPKSGRAA